MGIFSNKKIGLALGGGAALGPVHIGVLKALEEKEIKISFVSGTSIGAFAAALFAFGKSWEEIEKLTSKLDWIDISKISLSQYGLLSNEKLGNLLEKELKNVTFSDSKIPLAVIATNVETGKKIIINSGSVSKAVMASSCIPGIFIPVEINNSLLVDGGIVENVPITPLKDMGAKKIIAVNLSDIRGFKKPGNILDILVNSLEIAVGNIAQKNLQDADIVIAPDLSEFNPLDTSKKSELIEIGYTEAIKVLKND